MNKFKFFSLLMGLVFGSLAFVACGDDDDSDATTNGGDLASQIVGKWYLTETSEDKVLVNFIEFKADMTGTFGEYKAKAKNNWQIEGGDAPFNYAINGKRVVMTVTSGKETGKSREGDVVFNSDGTATVTPIEDGKTGNTMTMRRVTNQTPQDLIQELLKDKKGGAIINDRIVGTWIWGEPGQPAEEGHHSAGYVFESNGRCTYYNRDQEYYNNEKVLMHEEIKEGTFTVDGVKLVMNWTKGSQYDGGSGVRHELDAEQLGIDEAEIMYPEEGDNGMFLKRYYYYEGRQGSHEEGPFYKAQ